LYTPFDVMIVPPTSGVLPGARSVKAFRLPLHSLMIHSRSVFDHVAGILLAP
jgi:hypothetical protein